MDESLVMLMAAVVGVSVVGVVAEALISAAVEGLRPPPPENTTITTPARRPPPSRSQ